MKSILEIKIAENLRYGNDVYVDSNGKEIFTAFSRWPSSIHHYSPNRKPLAIFKVKN
jgi:hypothetical protein